MLTTVNAEVDISGNVRLLEPLEVSKTTRAIVTLLDDNGTGDKAGNAKGVVDFLRQNRLPKDSRPTSKEIDDHIEEARNSWD